MRVSGVGGVACMRHGLICPLGLGDMQKGERLGPDWWWWRYWQLGDRYSNMDYIFWASITMVLLPFVMVCYNIGCQWKINLNSRWALLLMHLGGDVELCINEEDGTTTETDSISKPKITMALPIWHGDVHNLAFKTKNSIQYQEGSGGVDGEVLEHIWVVLNTCAYSMMRNAL